MLSGKKISGVMELLLRACLKIKFDLTIGIGLVHLNRKTVALNLKCLKCEFKP